MIGRHMSNRQITNTRICDDNCRHWYLVTSNLIYGPYGEMGVRDRFKRWEVRGVAAHFYKTGRHER